MADRCFIAIVIFRGGVDVSFYNEYVFVVKMIFLNLIYTVHKIKHNAFRIVYIRKIFFQ